MDKEKIRGIAEIVKSELMPLRERATTRQVEMLHEIVINACENALKYNDKSDGYFVARQAIKEEFEKNKKHAKKAAEELAKLSRQYQVSVGLDVAKRLLRTTVAKNVVIDNASSPTNYETTQSNIINITQEKVLKITEDLISFLKVESTEFDDISLTQQGCIDFGSRTPNNKKVTRDDSLIDMSGRGMNRDFQRHSLAFNLRLIFEKWQDVSAVDFSAKEGDELSDNDFKGNAILSKVAAIVLPDTKEDLAKDINRGPEHYKDMFSKLRKHYPRASFTPYIRMIQESKNKKNSSF